MDDKMKPIVAAGRNCWRIERADKARLLIDAATYYHWIAHAFEKAEKMIFIAGWDFDTRIPLEPDEKGRGERLGAFFLRLAKRNPDLQIDVLKWNFGALKQFTKPAAVRWLWRWWRADNIDFRLDSSHPFGCSHHQKIVVIDECLAACGGIDISNRRWDTSDHIDRDPRRASPDGELFGPWHDTTMMMSGPVARALGELSRERWKVATRAELDEIEPCSDEWPDGLKPDFENVDIAIARTRAPYEDLEEVREIEALTLDMIAAAKRFIYFENQYFTSGKVAAAIAERMKEEDPPEMVLVMPRTADGWLEQKAMDAARLKLVAAIGEVDRDDRFRVYVPVTKDRKDIYVHAKLAILDDRLLRVGSANLNNRSLGLDSECDVVIDAALPANRDTPATMTALRHRLIAEHLAISPEKYAIEEAARGSMIAAIEALRGGDKSLDLLDLEGMGAAEDFIASNEVLDPESVDEMFDPIAKGGLARSWASGRERLRRIRGRA
ncbi:MAG TPA: phospholipase D-like domain-containing protein [Sphingomicrobium sp.]|nr:phospholipase D-like domain-containing protein [Sphingomicrobium sp.]